MKSLHHFPLWLVTGLLYGLSWPIFEGVNLSFLAWFAFVPLFLFLEQTRSNFWKSMGGSYAAMVVFCGLSAGWLFNYPQSPVEVAIMCLLESVWFAMPFLPFFFLQKKLGFDRALWLFPLVWMLWEWVYLPLEFTMGTHLSAYSQSSNVWLVQYIDRTGMWGISFWLMLFNVLIFKAYKTTGSNLRNPVFYKKIATLALPMLGLPLLYSLYAFSAYDQLKGESMTVSLIPTYYSADFMLVEENGHTIVNETLYRNDSVALTRKAQGEYSDLYVWPETGTIYQLGYSNLGDILQEAVGDWESALLTGCKGIPNDGNKLDQRPYASGVLISHQNPQAVYHHKTILTPGQEAIPYHAQLAKLPNFPISEMDPHYFQKGNASLPLDLVTRNDESFKVGVSLCFEQWYPQHWTRLAQNGADFYVHLAGEGWYGEVGFQQFMANVSRLRCIENRKQGARSANVGLSLFIDQLGRMHHRVATGTIDPMTADLQASDTLTWYARHPNWFPLLGLLMLAGSLLFFAKGRYFV